jgi:hypothetical protein
MTMMVDYVLTFMASMFTSIQIGSCRRIPIARLWGVSMHEETAPYQTASFKKHMGILTRLNITSGCCVM